MNTNESRDVNRHTARCTGPVSVVLRCKNWAEGWENGDQRRPLGLKAWEGLYVVYGVADNCVGSVRLAARSAGRLLCRQTAARPADDAVRSATQPSYTQQRDLVGPRVAFSRSQQRILRQCTDHHCTIQGARPSKGTHWYTVQNISFIKQSFKLLIRAKTQQMRITVQEAQLLPGRADSTQVSEGQQMWSTIYRSATIPHDCHSRVRIDCSRTPKCFSFRGAKPPDSPTRGSAPGPRWGLRPQTPDIGARHAPPCQILNTLLNKNVCCKDIQTVIFCAVSAHGVKVKSFEQSCFCSVSLTVMILINRPNKRFELLHFNSLLKICKQTSNYFTPLHFKSNQ